MFGAKHKEWFYLHVARVAPPEDASGDPLLWKTWVVAALKAVHGEVGASMGFDVLQSGTGHAVIRVHYADRVKMASAVAAYVGHDNGDVLLRVVASSEFLSALVPLVVARA